MLDILEHGREILLGWLRSLDSLLTPDFLQGFIAGLGAAAVILFLLLLIAWISHMRKFCVVIRNGGQTVKYPWKAIRSHFFNLLDADGRLHATAISCRGNGKHFRVQIQAYMTQSGAKFRDIAHDLREKLMASVKEELGIETLKAVEFELTAGPKPTSSAPESGK